MKRIFSIVTIQLKFVAVILIFTLGFLVVSEVQAEDEYTTLIETLRKNGISVQNQTDYSKLVRKLKSMQIDVPESTRDNVRNYLDTGKASNSIKIQTSKPGILAWHFHNVIFLKKNIIFAQYDDGEMLGGDILLQISFSGIEVTGMKSLWNYH